MEPTKEEIIGVLKQAQRAFMGQDYSRAIEKYDWVEQYIQDDPENLAALWSEMGWTYYLMQDYPKAIAILSKALQSPHLNQKQVFDCLRITGFSHEYAGNPDKAIAFLQDALLQPVADEEKRYTYFELGKIFFAQNMSRDAKPYLEKAQKLLDKTDHDYLQTTLYYLGFIAFFEKEMEKSEDFFQTYIKNAANEQSAVPGYFGMAHLYFERKNFESLLEISQKIMQLDGAFFDRETIAFFLCKSYLALKKWKELGVFLPELKAAFPNGRYAAVYPEMQKALDYHRASPN